MSVIFLECNNDEFLIKSLGFLKKQISHERCKGEVVKKVGKKTHAIGIIDEDDRTNEPNDIKKFSLNQTRGCIKLLQKKDDKNKKLVLISPYLEHWILNRAKRNKMKPKDFNLPDDPKKLHSITNLERKPNFQKFLKKLIDIDTEIQTLRKWVEEVL